MILTMYLISDYDSLSLFFVILLSTLCFFFFFFNDTATTEIYTLSLHDALPISRAWRRAGSFCRSTTSSWSRCTARSEDTRLNSSHVEISYAVFCLKKKKKKKLTEIISTRNKYCWLSQSSYSDTVSVCSNR